MEFWNKNGKRTTKKVPVLFWLAFFVFLIFPSGVFAAPENNQVNVYLFWAEGCPHCEKEKEFLQELKTEYPEVSINEFEITKNRENYELLKSAGEKLKADVSGVPFTIIGDKYFIGFYNEKTTGAEIEKIVRYALRNGCADVVGEINEKGSCLSSEEEKKSEKINLPILGEIEIKNFSLPALTIIIAALDGFNPCAMWVLLFLISLLLGMQDRKKMWILGAVFIAISAAVYFLFMSAWLNLFLFLGFVFWVRIIIAGVAFFSGSYSIREYINNKDGACKVTGGEKRQKVFQKLRDIVHNEKFYLVLGGIILLAFAVNLVELICSAGLPAVFIKVLTMSHLPIWQYYFYLLLYIFIFMLDDLFVFFVAMITLRATGVSGKYSRFSRLAGGVIMIIIGLLLVFRPEWLMFG